MSKFHVEVSHRYSHKLSWLEPKPHTVAIPDRNAMILGKLQRAHYDLTGIMVRKGNYPLMALFQVSEIL
jgi:hypothetical protein